MAREPPGHACLLYADDERRRSVLVDYFLEGLLRAEKLLYMGGPGLEDGIVSQLSALCDTSALLASGQLVLLPARDAYLAGGTFNGASLRAAYGQQVDEAVSDGYRGLRSYADCSWLLDVLEGGLEQWVQYELEVDDLLAGLPVEGMCGFDLNALGELGPSLVDAVHPYSVGQPTRPSPFWVSHTADGRLSLSGEVDRFVADRAHDVLTWAIDLAVIAQPGPAQHGPAQHGPAQHGPAQHGPAQHGPTEIDLSGLRFIDAAGTAAVMASVTNKAVRLANAPKSFTKIVEVLSLG